MPIEGGIKKERKNERTKGMALYEVLHVKWNPFSDCELCLEWPQRSLEAGCPSDTPPIHPSANKCRDVISRPEYATAWRFCRSRIHWVTWCKVQLYGRGPAHSSAAWPACPAQCVSRWCGRCADMLTPLVSTGTHSLDDRRYQRP
jgi:hypothetical protein